MKRILGLLLAAAILVSLAACGQDSGSDRDKRKDRSRDREKGQLLQLQETVTLEDSCEFRIEAFQITQKVTPPCPDAFYSVYNADQGQVYLDVCVSYKNLDTEEIEADQVLEGTLVYGGEYRYSGFVIAEKDNRSDFTYANITDIVPLGQVYLHCLFALPEEVQTSDGALTLLLAVEQRLYRFPVREGSTQGVAGPDNGSVTKKQGEVVPGEWILVPDCCEFSIDYTAVTADVVPPNADSYYSHYEADQGMVYVDLCLAYKSLARENVDADQLITAELTYAGQYHYSGFSMMEEDSRADFTYTGIREVAPLTTEYLHVLFEVPEEVSHSDQDLMITFRIGGNTYTCRVR